MFNLKKLVALLLVVCMTAPAIVSCGKISDGNKNTYISDVQNTQNSLQNIETEELTIEELEMIADVLDKNIDTDELNDEELADLVDDLINSIDNTTSNNVSNLGSVGSTDDNITNLGTTEKGDGIYDNNGAMTKPFDQVYPELVENGAVEYSEESLLVKMNNSSDGKISAAMADAGVLKLEAVVPLDKYTWYKASLGVGADAQKTLEAVRALDEVVIAEYDYKVQTAAIDSYKEIDTALGLENNKNKKDQWYLNYVGIPDGFKYMKYDGGKPSVIVAVIDTGVDIDHEDLSKNIWKNTKEKPGNGIDDDGNGYIDDYYGVNIVSGKGNGDDDNGHGTHVAGIIAAQNNNLGTVGIAYKTTIMPIKAASASGYLLQSDIAKAVLYAYENGAEVINMSFGGSACSIAVQDALATAYTRCVLVASAGNDGVPNEHPKLISLPNYPAALSYVLGVMAVDETGTETAFTNWDYKAYNGIEYELYAPGYNIMSTLPDNRYGVLSGTSMAAPVVSAMAAILRSEFEDRDTYPTKFIYGQLASTSENYGECINPEAHGDHNLPQIANLYTALTKLPKPDVNVEDYLTFDTVGLSGDTKKKNNGDGVIDAGETISLGLILRNRWGMSENTIVTLDAKSSSGVSDPYITFVNPTVNYDTVGTYSTQDCGKIYTGDLHTGWEDPFIIKIADNCPNDYVIKINVTLQYKNGIDKNDKTVYTKDASFSITVRNGVVLPTVIDEDMTLTPDNLYIIANSTVIEKGATVRVLAGTNIQFWSNDPTDPYADSYMPYLSVKGKLLVEGTKEAPVKIYPSELKSKYNVAMGESTGYISLVYADITNLGYCKDTGKYVVSNVISYADHCTFRTNGGSSLYYRYVSSGNVVNGYTISPVLAHFRSVSNSVFYKIGLAENSYSFRGNADRCIFADCAISSAVDIDGNNYFSAKNCVFLGNTYYDAATSGKYVKSSLSVNTFKTNAASNVKVYYRDGDGTTYVISDYKIDSLILEKLGGHFLVLNDAEESAYLNSKLPANWKYKVGVKYDYDLGCYVWSDGTPVDPSFDKNGVLVYDERNFSVNLTIGTQGVYFATGSGSYYLYEFPGKVLPTEITFDNYEVNIDTGVTYQLAPVNAPVQLGLGDFIYESRDESVVKVSETGLVTPVGKGTADVYVYSEDRAVYNYVTIRVADPVRLDSIELSVDQIAVGVGETISTKVKFTPADTTRRNVTYTSSDDSILTVDEHGNITGVSSGKAIITATCDGKSESVELVCAKKAEYLGLSTPSMLLSLGATQDLPSVITNDGAETSLVWRSIDTSVATVENGKLIPKALGTTTLEVRDTYSGLRANIHVIVQTSASSPVKRFERGYNCYYVLLENGNLYQWTYTTSPALIDTGVKDFSAYTGNDAVLKLYYDNRVALSDRGAIDYFARCGSIDRIIFASNGAYWCITSSGNVYAYGNNSYGRLGVGTNVNVTEAQLVNLDNVVDIIASGSTTYFLTADGNLYYAGNQSRASYSPTLIDEGVKEIEKCENNYVSYYTFDGRMGSFSFSNGKNALKPKVEFDLVSWGYDSVNQKSGIGIKDGKAYKITAGYTTVTEIPGISNAVYSYSYNDTHYIATADGMLYGYGANNVSYNYFAGATVEADVTTPALILLERTAEKPQVTLTVQDGDKVKIYFNKALTSIIPKLYADGVQTTLKYEIDLNELTIYRANGFSEGVAYSLVLDANTVNCAGGISNSESMTIGFTYSAALDTPENEAPEASPVIHESVLNASIERIWTSASFIADLNAIQAEYQYNNAFYNNAILNRISTDTNVEHWLRIVSEAMTGGQIPLGQNWWGSTNETAIELQMVDYSDFINYSRLMYEPYLTEAPEDTFPFVTSVKIFDKNKEEVTTVGNEQITVRVTFNRDMDTSIPLSVRFGSAYPYGDYELDGKWKDARTWEGKYKLTTLIEGGIQYFTIENGCSATDDLVLMCDRARFSFEIDTTAAQALIMQGEATSTGIKLSWTQDDFDTLMGYNVYRATSEDGLYTRVNTSVIPADIMEFFDSTVEPGVIYYYNFTVVKTDLSESTPSGKITIRSMDTMAPDVYHSPVYNATTGANLIISATVTDNLNITYARVYYRTKGTDVWRIAQMSKYNDKYSAIIIADHITIEGVEYYIEAFDGVNYTYKGSADTPYLISVQEVVSSDSLGDVNGDGEITNLDALMLLKAINDQLNLTAEEFARADLDGNGTLAAKEALRILQYVSGAVGSVDMRS